MGRRVSDETTIRLRPCHLIQSITRAADILEAVGSNPRGLTPAEIAKTCRLNHNTSYSLINTLGHLGYLQRRPSDGRWVLGPAIAERAAERAAQVEATSPPARTGG
jgi:DNA-binding IclR family transcriptional regulator